MKGFDLVAASLAYTTMKITETGSVPISLRYDINSLLEISRSII